MHRRERAFWQWSAGEWREVIGAIYEAFERVHAVGGVRNGLRPYLLDVAYRHACGSESSAFVVSREVGLPSPRLWG